MLNGFSSIETEMYVCMGPNKIYPTILSPPRFIRPIDEYALYNILVNWQSDRGEPVPWKHETPFDDLKDFSTNNSKATQNRVKV